MADNLTKHQRSYCMSRIRSTDTGLERTVRLRLGRQGLRFVRYAADLPGRPDIVFRKARVAVFIDGDFWHGYRFPAWRGRVSRFWKVKIDGNRARDARNFRKLRQRGWTVVRIWQHQLKRDPDTCIERVVTALKPALLVAE